MIRTERLVLRKPTLKDADQIEQLASNYEVAKTTLTIPHPYPQGSAVYFINNMLKAEVDGKIVIFTIFAAGSETLIGIINLTLSPKHGRGELGYWIGEPHWGKGYGTEATEAIIDYGFNQLNLNKIFAQAYTRNPGSWRIMEKVGMTYEGTLKQHFIRFGQYIDIVNYGILKEDFNNTHGT